MKITIEKGTRVEDAIKMFSNFLNENFSEYPILKNDMRIYITLKNEDNQTCSDNEQEYILNQSGLFKNVFEDEKRRVTTELMREWGAFLHFRQKNVNTLRRKVDLDNNYLETAHEKGRKEENIEKRKIQLNNNKLDLKNAIKALELAESLNMAIKNNNYKTYFFKSQYGSTYKYRLDATFVFDNIEGYTGYFDDRGLHEGKPKY